MHVLFFPFQLSVDRNVLEEVAEGAVAMPTTQVATPPPQEPIETQQLDNDDDVSTTCEFYLSEVIRLVDVYDNQNICTSVQYCIVFINFIK